MKRASLFLVFILSISNCNLTLDTESYPYEPIVAVGVSSPKLIFTEVLVWSSELGPSADERGEYIEIKNIGNLPIKVENIFIDVLDEDNDLVSTIEITRPRTPEAREAIEGLKLLQPGGYFVFIRYETPKSEFSKLLDPGKFYDYGKHGTKFELKQKTGQQLVLSYSKQNEIVISDTLKWSNSSLVGPHDTVDMKVDHSLVLDRNSEKESINGNVQNWCVANRFFQFEGIHGSPGSSSSCEPIN